MDRWRVEFVQVGRMTCVRTEGWERAKAGQIFASLMQRAHPQECWDRREPSVNGSGSEPSVGGLRWKIPFSPDFSFVGRKSLMVLRRTSWEGWVQRGWRTNLHKWPRWVTVWVLPGGGWGPILSRSLFSQTNPTQTHQRACGTEQSLGGIFALRSCLVVTPVWFLEHQPPPHEHWKVPETTDESSDQNSWQRCCPHFTEEAV